MRTLILLTALLAGAAQAEQVAVAPSASGGYIVLTSRVAFCPENTWFGYAQGPHGKTSAGCWAPVSPTEFVMVYMDGVTQKYQSADFVRVTVKEKGTL